MMDMEKTKICFKCGRELPLSEFYKHPKMGDGHLNKCKDCTRADVRTNYIEKSKLDTYMEKERARGREKYARLGYRGRLSDEQCKKRELYPRLRSAKQALNISVRDTEELHHWNYNNILNVIVLNRRLHRRVHSGIRLNIDKGFYYRGEQPLDTLEKRLAYIKEVCDREGFDFSEVKTYQK